MVTEKNMKVKKLDNGLRYLVTGDMCPKNRKTAIILYMNTGSIYENENERGVSHFIEHLYFNGTCSPNTNKTKIKNNQKMSMKKCRCNYFEIFKEIDNYGGEMNAYTDKDHTAFHMKIPNKYIADGLNLLSDIIQNTYITKDKIEKEKGIVIEELNTVKSDSEDFVQNKLFKMMFGNNTLGYDMIGGRKYILNYNIRTIKNYIKKFYRPDNAHIVVSTNMKQNKIDCYIKKYFSNFKPQTKNSLIKPQLQPIPKQLEPKIRFCDDHDSNCIITMGYVICGYNSLDKYPLRLLSYIIGEMYSSRLFINLRENNGLVYDVDSGAYFYKDYGVFLISCQMDCKNTNKVIKIILQVIKDITSYGVEIEELKSAKNKLIQDYLDKDDDVESSANEYGMQMVYNDYILPLSKITKQIKVIPKKSVEAMAHKYLDISNLNIIVSGKSNKKLIKDIIINFEEKTKLV